MAPKEPWLTKLWALWVYGANIDSCSPKFWTVKSFYEQLSNSMTNFARLLIKLRLFSSAYAHRRPNIRVDPTRNLLHISNNFSVSGSSPYPLLEFQRCPGLCSRLQTLLYNHAPDIQNEWASMMLTLTRVQKTLPGPLQSILGHS